MTLESSAELPAAVTAPLVGRARFAPGDIVRHRMFDFRGVVFDIDPVFANSDEWYEAIPEEIRSEEHTSELQSLMRISYAVFCLKKKKTHLSRKQTIRSKTQDNSPVHTSQQTNDIPTKLL